MLRILLFTVVALGTIAAGSPGLAQVAQVVYYPVTPTVVAPPQTVVVQRPVTAAQTVVVQRPVVAPQPTVVYRPVTPYVVASPVVAPAPAVVAPAPLVATPVTVTRRRPILGGTVTRTYYRYQPAPVVAAPVAVPAL